MAPLVQEINDSDAAPQSKRRQHDGERALTASGHGDSLVRPAQSMKEIADVCVTHVLFAMPLVASCLWAADMSRPVLNRRIRPDGTIIVGTRNSRLHRRPQPNTGADLKGKPTINHNRSFAGSVEFSAEFSARFRPRPDIRHVLFDFDGTLSLVRQGWPDVVVPMFVDASVPKRRKQSRSPPPCLRRYHAAEWRAAIYQMIELAAPLPTRR